MKRKPRSGATVKWSTNLQQSREEYPMEKRQVLQQMVLGKLDSDIQKKETGPHAYTTKNKFKMDKWSKCETGIHQNCRQAANSLTLPVATSY